MGRRVRWMLPELGIPTELVLEIIDLTDYHPTIFLERKKLVKMCADEGHNGRGTNPRAVP